MKKRINYLLFPFLLVGLMSCSNKETTSEFKPFGYETNDDNGNQSQNNPVSQETFKENNIIFSAPLISDEHVGYSDATVNNNERLGYVLDTYKELYPETKFSAVLSTGDQTQNGKANEVDDFMSIYNSKINIDETPFVFCHGNHDSYWSGCLSTSGFFNEYNKYNVYKQDLDIGQATYGNRHLKINGIHFICLNLSMFMPNSNKFTDNSKQFLKTCLDKAIQENKNQPIFVLTHSPATNTCYGSLSDNEDGPWGSSDELYDMLKNYPQVISLSGHTHYSITEPRTLNAREFVSYQCGSICDIDMDTNTGARELSNRRSYSFGSYLEIDNEGNSRITRYDLIKKEMISKPFIIEAPKDDKSHLTKLSDLNRKANNKAPEPVNGGKYEAIYIGSNSFELKFDAFDDDEIVTHYLINSYVESKEEITDETEAISTTLLINDYWNYPQGKKGIISLELVGREGYTISVTAYDSWDDATTIFLTNK